MNEMPRNPPPELVGAAPRMARPVAAHRRPIPWRVVLSAAPVLLAVLAALLAPGVAPHSPISTDLGARLRPPAWQRGGGLNHLLGSDLLGRDVLSRLIWGARISLPIAFLATGLGAAVGSALGLIAGYYRGWVDAFLTKLVDVQLAFPFVLFAISVIAVAGPGMTVLVIVLAIGSWVGHARIVRGLSLTLREREFVLSARALGANGFRILVRHLLPDVLSVIVVMATFDVGRIIILESTLSFLGLGVQPQTPSWGSDLRDAAVYVRQAWWMATFPGVIIMAVVLGVNLLGDTLRDILDPRTVKAKTD
jgi:peptide/nickel transport system permease protein